MNENEIKDYVNKLKFDDEINKQYFIDGVPLNYNENKETFPAFNLQKDDLDGEIWKEYPPCIDFLVSNLGRIKFQDVVLQQCEKSENAKYGQTVGYLQISKAKHKNEYTKIKDNYVYQMVARTWFEKDLGHNEVHHITNDGYNNNVNNLLLVDKDTHQKIHEWFKKKN